MVYSHERALGGLAAVEHALGRVHARDLLGDALDAAMLESCDTAQDVVVRKVSGKVAAAVGLHALGAHHVAEAAVAVREFPDEAEIEAGALVCGVLLDEQVQGLLVGRALAHQHGFVGAEQEFWHEDG